jgi:integrase
VSVGKTKDGRFYVQYRVPYRNSPKREYFGKGVEARRAARERDAEIKLMKTRNEDVRESHVYLDELAKAYIEHEKVKGRDRKFLNEVTNRLNKSFLPALTHVPVHKLKAKDFDKLALEYKDLSNSSFNRYITYLNVIFNFGVEFEHIEKNPMANWRKRVMKREKPRDLEITIDDVKAIVANAAPHVQKAIKLVLNTGCRPGKSELLRIKYSDVDFDANRVRIRGSKTARSDRYVPLRDEFLAEIRGWQEAARCEYIVEYEGKPVNGFKKGFNAAVRRSGIGKEVVPYHLRHFFASTLLANKADIKAVASLMGHSGPDMLFKVYYHLIGDSEKEAVEKLPTL